MLFFDSLLRSFTSWPVPDVSKVLITRWGHDSNVYGSYTVIPKGVNGIINQKALAEPVPGMKASDSKVFNLLLISLLLFVLNTQFHILSLFLISVLDILKLTKCSKKKSHK